MFIYCICTQYLVGASFALITASIRRGMEVISLWHCWGGMEAQVSLTVAFSSSALLGLVSLIFLLTIPHRFSMGFRSGEFAGQSSTVTPWSLNQLLVPLAVCPAGKWNQHLHKACQQKEAWSALKFPGRWMRWLWTSENTVDQHQQMTWQPKSSLTVETSHWTSSNMDSVPLHSSSRLWDLDFQMKCKIYFHLKRVEMKCFTLHAMHLKYMKVSLFEITYKKKWTFPRHSNLLSICMIIICMDTHTSVWLLTVWPCVAISVHVWQSEYVLEYVDYIQSNFFLFLSFFLLLTLFLLYFSSAQINHLYDV